MTYLEFFENYGTEAKCKAHWIELRKKQDVLCQKCGCVKSYWLLKKEQFQCAQCKFRTTLRSGTIMDSSKLLYRDWYLAMYLMTSSKKGISALELQRQLGRKRYEPVWMMMHKIRDLMLFREEQYRLTGELEVDEIFIRIANTLEPEEVLKRGKGSQRQALALIAVESKKEDNDKQAPDNNNRKGGKRMGYVKIEPIKNHGATVAKRAIEKMTKALKRITSDKGSEFKEVHELAEHHQFVSTKDNNDTHLPWIGVVTANLKRMLLGIYHSVKRENLARYLAEFCYKVNRRNFGLNIFERLVNISALPNLVVT